MENDLPNIQYAVPLFGVSNMEASLKFYTDGLGFAVLNTWTPRGKN
jgi:catechol 2,3-dioxygenase-like lactoylglutathione lyase family enzyme